MTKKVDTRLAQKRRLAKDLKNADRLLRAGNFYAQGMTTEEKVVALTKLVAVTNERAVQADRAARQFKIAAEQTVQDAQRVNEAAERDRNAADEAINTARVFQSLLNDPSTIRAKFALGARVLVVDGVTVGNAKFFQSGVVVGVISDRDGISYQVKHSLEGYARTYKQDDVHDRGDNINPFGGNPAFEIPGEGYLVNSFIRLKPERIAETNGNSMTVDEDSISQRGIASSIGNGEGATTFTLEEKD